MVSQYWNCFVDESGDLDAGDDEVLLAGVLLPARDDPFLSARLREAIRQVAPLVPWPFHRWLATKPCIYPLWREQRPRVELDAAVDDACRRALIVWEKHRSELLGELRQLCRVGEEPEPGQLRTLRRVLKKADRQGFERLLQYSQNTCQAVARRPAELVEAKWPDRRSGLVFMVGEESAGANADDDEGRYFGLLVRLLQRVRDVLELQDGEQVVSVEAASRYATHPELPDADSRPTKLARNHLAEACSRVQSDPEGDELAPRVRLTAKSVSHYDDAVPAGLVVADNVANFLRRRLLRKPRLGPLQKSASSYFQLPISDEERCVSFVAATGTPAEAIDLSRMHQFDDARRQLERLPQRWPKEQAVQWIQFFESDGEEST